MPCGLHGYRVGVALTVGRRAWAGPKVISLCCWAHCCPKLLSGARPRPPARLLLVSRDNAGPFGALLKPAAGPLRARLPARVLLVSLQHKQSALEVPGKTVL